MPSHTRPVLQVLLLVTALLPASVATRAQPQRAAEELGLSGYVLAPDGTPVSSGSVVIQPPGFGPTASTTSIDRTGRFRLVPDTPGDHQLSVTVSGLAPYRVSVNVPPSRTLKLPVIRLSPATYFRVRFASAAGEPIASPLIRRQSLDTSGAPFSRPLDDRVPDQIDSEGTITIGPLPRGITTMALDMPLLAQTRLPDLIVTGSDALLDAGTVIVQPGAVLHVDVFDATGAPRPGHDVSLEDASPLSPLFLRPARTNQQGRATFDRLGKGRYRVRTRSVGRCGNQPLSIARVVSVSGNGTLRTRLVLGGHATFQLSSPLGPLRAATVSASPDSGSSTPPAWLRSRSGFSPFAGRPIGPFAFQASCSGSTDADGRVTLTNFPPGPTRVDVRLLNSTYVRRVNVPDDGREVPILVPGGYLPLHVTNAMRNNPVAGAAIVWSAGGARVEATTSANGEALLEGVGTTAGTLAITAPGYEPAEAQLSEPPAVLQAVALVPAPVTSVQARVTTASGEPLASAVVEFSPENPIEVAHVAVTGAKGSVSFPGAPPGPLRVVATADGFVTAMMRVANDSRSGIVMTLSRGYRVITNVESAAGLYLVRVVNEAGASMEGLLDIASDRIIEPPGRLSLGPLPPGAYAVELHGSRERRQERIRVVDRDVQVTFR